MDKSEVNDSSILITGGAGFIGFHLSKYLIENHPDLKIVSIDNLNNYYDVELKNRRIEELNKLKSKKYEFTQLDITNKDGIDGLFAKHNFSLVINLAAQAGVRYARENPDSYLKSNIDGFYNLISISAKYKPKAFLYASSSSVYGANKEMPFNESDLCATPMSLYAATKISNEMLASSYFYTNGLKSIGLRFFNVYGPWGRPDMAYYRWTESLKKNEVIELREKGEMYRDMTYIDDVVKSISKLLFELNWDSIGHEVVNIGNTKPIKIVDVLNYIMNKLEISDIKIVHKSRGDEEPIKTFADTTKLNKLIGFVPNTDFKDGLDYFISWHNEYTNEISI